MEKIDMLDFADVVAVTSSISAVRSMRCAM